MCLPSLILYVFLSKSIRLNWVCVIHKSCFWSENKRLKWKSIQFLLSSATIFFAPQMTLTCLEFCSHFLAMPSECVGTSMQLQIHLTFRLAVKVHCYLLEILFNLYCNLIKLAKQVIHTNSKYTKTLLYIYIWMIIIWDAWVIPSNIIWYLHLPF